MKLGKYQSENGCGEPWDNGQWIDTPAKLLKKMIESQRDFNIELSLDALETVRPESESAIMIRNEIINYIKSLEAIHQRFGELNKDYPVEPLKKMMESQLELPVDIKKAVDDNFSKLLWGDNG